MKKLIAKHMIYGVDKVIKGKGKGGTIAYPDDIFQSEDEEKLLSREAAVEYVRPEILEDDDEEPAGKKPAGKKPAGKKPAGRSARNPKSKEVSSEDESKDTSEEDDGLGL